MAAFKSSVAPEFRKWNPQQQRWQIYPAEGIVDSIIELLKEHFEYVNEVLA